MNTPLPVVVALAATSLMAPVFANAQSDSTPGQKIYSQACATCHNSGLMHAPKLGDARDWKTRLQAAGSIDALVEIAEHGKGDMPPRGGNPDLTDDQIKSTVQYMLSKSGASP